MADFITAGEVKNAVARMAADAQNYQLGGIDLGAVANGNFDEAILTAGSTYQFPTAQEAIDNNLLFSQKVGTGKAYGVIVLGVDGPDAGLAKKFYFTSGRKRVRQYGDDLRPTALAPVQGTMQLNKDIANAPTMGAIWDLLAGKKVKVEDAPNSPVTTAAYTNRQITGLRETHVYNMSFVA